VKRFLSILILTFLLSPLAFAQLPGPQAGGGGGSGAKSFVHLNAGNARASTNTTIVIYATLAATGTDLTVTHSATLGTSVRCNTAGKYLVQYTGRLGASGVVYLIQSATLTNSPTSVTARSSSSAVVTTDPIFSGGAIINCAVDDLLWMNYGQNPSITGNGDWNNQMTILGPL